MSFRDFIAGAVIDGAEAIGASGISQTDGFVNTVLNYLAPGTPQPQSRGFSQLGGFFSNPDRVPRSHYVSGAYPTSTTYAGFEKAASKTVGAKSGEQKYPSYQGKAFYENQDKAIRELREGKARGDHIFAREEPVEQPPMRAAPPPFSAKAAEKIKRGIDRGDDKFIREKPSTGAPMRMPAKPPKSRKKRVMQPPSI